MLRTNLPNATRNVYSQEESSLVRFPLLSNSFGLLDGLEKYKTVSIYSEDAMAKTYLLSILVEQSIARNGEIHYLDCDLQYSSMNCQNKGTNHLSSALNRGLKLYVPAELGFTHSLVDLMSSEPKKEAGLVVLDSLNSMQNLLREQDPSIDWVKANHEAAIVLTLLQEFCSHHGKILIISNIARAKPSKTVSGSWEKDISGGRMIRLFQFQPRR